ncbi:hypothetical protein [Aureimonas leprariae]|uniref:Lipoprotein n=1 Tax=Plantimonas leprariae TaxID=2615207 RepID=A0A7V7PPH6_9HYPH|nr:hypothetical protein [Aureimonas leprariae]KAB0679864.1 hypothetical protein F6X38_11610 [Aureimonas leprariae]
MIRPGTLFRRFALAFVLTTLFGAAGCRSENGSLPSVFGAVFGVENAASIPYQVGKIPDPVVRPQDKVIGDAANNPGQCIYRTPADRRYRAKCPDGYAIGDVN